MMTPINGKSEIQKNTAALNLVGYYLKARVSFYNKVARQSRKVEVELKKLGDFQIFSAISTPRSHSGCMCTVHSSLYQKTSLSKIKQKKSKNQISCFNGILRCKWYRVLKITTALIRENTFITIINLLYR